MSALEALKLAKETGVKVRPIGKLRSYYRYYDSANGKPKRLFQGQGRAIAFPEEQIINPDGSPVEWEEVHP